MTYALITICLVILLFNSYVNIKNYFLVVSLQEEILDLIDRLMSSEQQHSPEVGLDKRLHEIQTAKFATLNKRIK